MTAPQSPQRAKVTLCLSGGGLRATLFHLGVIKALRDHSFGPDPGLACVRTLYAVSGGAIAAGHLVSNWSGYNGEDEAQFARLEAALVAFAGSNLRDRVLRRWLLLGWLRQRRTDWLQRYYARLLGSGSIAEVQAAQPDAPELHVLATSFSTGEVCAFSPGGVEILRPGATAPVIDLCGADLPLAFATAASSAFPPLFPTVCLTPALLGGATAGEFADVIPLSDGGVFDNLGLASVRASAAPSDDQGWLIVSNAGASFNTERKNAFSSALARNVRASDIMMHRIGDATQHDAKARAGYREVRIGDAVPGSRLPPDVQYQLRLVRTDLDRFAPDLSALLIEHGYDAATKLLVDLGAHRSRAAPARAAVADAAALQKVAQRAAARKYRSLMTAFRDPTLLVIWALILIMLGIVALTLSRAWDTYQLRRDQLVKDALSKSVAEMQVAYASGDKRRFEALLGASVRTAEITERDRSRDIVADPVVVAQGDAIRIATAKPATIAMALVAYPQPVYVQFAGSLTRAQMIGLVDGLRRSGWNMTDTDGGERTSTAAGMHKVLFAGQNDAAAQELAPALTLSGLFGTVTAERRDAIGPKNLEVWVSG